MDLVNHVNVNDNATKPADDPVIKPPQEPLTREFPGL